MMALGVAPRNIAAPRAVPGRVAGSRGIPTRIVLDVTDALGPCLEGVALADDVASAVQRIVMAAAASSPHAAVNEAQRLGHRAAAYRTEFRRMAAFIEDPDGGQAA